TNAHVVRRAEKITVTLGDQSKHDATVISSDPDNDLAVLKIDPPAGKKLPHLPLGRSNDLMVGETVIAIGNPLGYANSVTTGVISAVNRTLSFGGDVEVKDLIQTDAPINPGNSGGPLLNIKGELIGINTAIRADAQNIGFAIPVDRLGSELGELLDFESLNRVIFGAAIAPHREDGEDQLRVESVRKGTPADGKLRTGDRILALNDRPVRKVSEYACAMVQLDPGAAVRLRCERDGKELEVEVVLKPKPRPDGRALGRTLFGVTLKPVTKQLARDMRLSVAQGLLVVGIDAGSPAEEIGLRLKDVVFQIGRPYVIDLETLGNILENVKPGDKIQIGIVRGNFRAWVPITAR
ncbi:MAG: trypsin-like peptidase domain-containing protein, partial [Planctomycetota bacterium]